MEKKDLFGIGAALGAILFYGTYAVPVRIKAAASIDPVVFQAYKSLFCFSSAWLVLTYVSFKFTWWGLLGGATWVITGLLGIKAVKLAGIGSTQSLWSSISIFISFFWGTFAFHEHIESLLLSCFSLLLMAIGMAGIAFTTTTARSRKGDILSSDHSTPQHPDFLRESDKAPVLEPLVPATEVQVTASVDDQNFYFGVFYAVLAGFLNGSLMVPLKVAHQSVVGIEYLISFGIGGMISGLLLLFVYQLTLYLRGEPLVDLHLGKRTAFPALAAGALWSLGNFCSIYATIYLGMALGFPLVQCQITISALWAIFYFNEVSGFKPVFALVLSTLLVVAGATLLVRFGTVG